MGSGRGLPGRDRPERTETVYERDHTRVTRLYFPGYSVIRKQPLGPQAGSRLRRETGILERLRGVEGVAQLVDRPGYPDSIVLADAGTASLAELAKSLPIDDVIGLATELARAVAGMHRCGVMHRDINPANVVLSGAAPTLVDFALATSVPELRPGFTHPTEIVGTLAYLAPEATGRTGRSVDQRADLYALGATLYEAATGAPPFGTGDPLHLTHDHLARVPVPPAEVNPAVPGALSRIILHLLEKDPDHRYQSADGLAHDLERLRDADAQAAEALRVGEHDLPPLLLPPSRLVGRDTEVAALREAFDGVLAGRCQVLLVGGPPGVGKTALVDQLRPKATGSDAWFVAGKFDQYRRDLEFDGVAQAFRALGRLLLAESEGELTAVRERLLAALGPNAGLATAVLPEFATLLGIPPEPGDPLTAQMRAQRNAVEILRAVASRKRPVVFFVDDLQWAGRTPLGLFDLVLGEEPIEGLLLVGAYRDGGDVDAGHPLAGLLSRWQQQGGVRHLRLDNLPEPALAGLIVEMLHADRTAAAELAEVIAPHTSGNPYETVELLDALRRAGALAVSAGAWRWDVAAVRAHLGEAEPDAPSTARLEALPPRSRAVVEAMACLGGRAEVDLLQTAAGEPAEAVEQALAPALDEGLLVAEPGTQQTVRFRHDRLREAVLAAVDPPRRRELQLAMARRLASVSELFALAADQYLGVLDAVHDPAERQAVVELLRGAADQAALIGDHARVDTLLAAALRLIDPADAATLAAVHTGRHAACYGLGRLEEADEEYRIIEALCPAALDRVVATAIQIASLTHRARFAEAIGLGIESLRQLGIPVPDAARLPDEAEREFGRLYQWLDSTDLTTDLARPEITDATVLAASHVLSAAMPTVYLAADDAALAWLSLKALQVWSDHGPAPALLHPVSLIGFPAIRRGDYRAVSLVLRRILAVSDARGYEPGTSSQARAMFAVLCWSFEPIDNAARAAQRARDGLIATGDPANAGYACLVAVNALLDCAPSLDAWAAEAQSGAAFTRRTGNEQVAHWLDRYLWLAGVLRGEGPVADESASDDRYVGNPLTIIVHLTHAVAAAVFGDLAGLTRHTAAAMPVLHDTASWYAVAMTRLLRGLALAGQARTAGGDQRCALLAELDEQIGWLAERAADAPDNFLHLVRLLEAERAWAVGDFRAAAFAFDAARREVAGRQRPWHRALITEHAARFYLAHGMDQVGHDLLARAREQYDAWGATAKVAQLDWAYPTLHPASETSADPTASPSHQRATVTTGTLDLLGILSASQALSSQTSLERLQARVVEVLGALTGATAVHLLLRDDDRQDWLRPTPTGTVPVGSGHETTVPLSVLRYVQRTGEPLVVADATDDDRFARDPYLADAGCCSLLAVPILSRGTLRAVLLLENRLLRSAFTGERLDAVTLVAGQLAVSLDNAQLYAELVASRARIVAAGDTARRRIERDLHDGAQQRLVSLALRLRTNARTGAGAQAAQLNEAADELGSVVDDLRELARGIHPAALANGGLKPALKALVRRSAVPVRLDVHTDQRLPEPVEIAAYYAVAEALTNTAKHAQATVVDVHTEADDGDLRIQVHDNGRGGADLSCGTGLIGIKDRIEALNGHLRLHSPPDAGTTLQITLPLDQPGDPGLPH